VSSITTWVRFEPGCRTVDMNDGLQARIYDPLWLLARQWQLGEFQGEDNGSPVSARWEGESTMLSRYAAGVLAPGATTSGVPLNLGSIPLEAFVESETVHAFPDSLDRLRLAADTGRHFLRLLEQQPVSRSYSAAVVAAFPFTLPSDRRAALDRDSLAFVDVVLPRVPDGRKLAAALRTVRGNPPALPPGLAVDPGDVAEVMRAADTWLRWRDALIATPLGTSAWQESRIEYAFSVAARLSDGEKVLTAQQYYSGSLDWHDFSLNDGASLGSPGGPAASVVRTVVPAPVTYRGMPAQRFWEFEDARVDFGAVDAGPQDLARMLLVEFAVSYGNDWFVIPVDLAVGAISRTRSLVVTNTFGETFLIPSATAAGGRFAEWRMFQLSSLAVAGQPLRSDPDLFFLAPATLARIESRPVEEVLFLRDEMANMAWGVERVVESAIERPINRIEQRPSAVAVAPADGTPIYRLATTTPENWVPLVPVRTGAGLRLRRGQLLRADGSREFVRAQGAILERDGKPGGVDVYEEEVPREGIRVTRAYQLARSQDGSTRLWIGRRKQVGRGEGASGLQFDRLDR